MKQFIAIITLALSMVGTANAASAPILNISGGATPWALDATVIELSDVGTVRQATGVFSGLVGGNLTNIASVIDLNLIPINSNDLNITVFDNFKTIDTSGTVVDKVNTFFILRNIDTVIRTPTVNGELVRVDTQIEAIVDGVNAGIFGFRWELSNNGNTGSYSVSTPIPQVPVPAAAWLFGSALMGLVGVTKRRKTA